MFDEANIAAAISACASEGWTDAARNDAVADEFSTALEEICATYNFGRCDDSEATDALVSLASLALSRDASAVASAVDHFDMSDATKKLLDVIGVEIFTPLMECADAVDDRIAEACACALVDACAEACGPRDMFVMALGALQSRVERAAKDLDGDDDDHDYAGHHEPSVRHRGWRLTGAICAGLATWLRRAKNPASLAPNAIPIVASLAALCGRCARFVAEAEGGPERAGCEPASRHHGPEAAYRGVGEFFKVACDAMHGERAGGHALADGMRALALDPRRLFRPTPRGRLCTHPDHEWVLQRLGTLDHLLSFTDFATNDETSDETSQWLARDEATRQSLASSTTSHVAAALIAWRWLVEAEEQTPWPSIVNEGSPLGDGCSCLTLAKIAPLADALVGSERSPTHFVSGLELASLAFRRAPQGMEDGCVAGRELMRKLQVVMARTADAGARELARKAFVRALALHRPRRRLDVLRQCLEAPAPSGAVAAMLVTLVKREMENAWPERPGEEQADEPARPFLPAAVAAVESQIAHALDPGSRPRRGVGATPAWLSDASAVADVVGAALNALRFVLMREGGLGPEWKGSAPAGAWPRRRELLDAAVKPAAEWARERLAECDEKDGGWEALMGYHHVLEVSERIVEFCEERDEREAP